MSFPDSRVNVSLKNYGLLKYADNFCPNVKCILQMDSNAIANVRGVEKLCEKMAGIIWILFLRSIISTLYPHSTYQKTGIWVFFEKNFDLTTVLPLIKAHPVAGLFRQQLLALVS